MVDDIITFELLTKPTKKWLDIVSDARKKHNRSSESWVDYVEPLWYPEIQKDSVLLKNLKVELGDDQSPSSVRW